MDSNDLLPASLLVHCTPQELREHFPAIALLQPVSAFPGGVRCAPRAAPELAREGIAAVPLAIEAENEIAGWPDPPSRVTGHWYIASPDHLPPPPGFDLLVQLPGEGFGTWPHPTTRVSLRMLDHLPDGAAIDAGCGSGLLTQAWATTRGPVSAIDLDPQAITQARAAMTRTTHSARVTWHTGPLRHHVPTVTGTIVLANLPEIAHIELIGALNASHRAILVCGVRTSRATPLLDRYQEAGWVGVAHDQIEGWGCWIMRRTDSVGDASDEFWHHPR